MARRDEAQLQVEVPETEDLRGALLRLLAHASAEEEAAEGAGAEVPLPDAPDSFRRAGDLVLLLGTIQGDVRGSAYLHVVHGLAVPGTPSVDAARLEAVDAAVRHGLEAGLLSSVRRCGVGGLAVALARCCLEEELPAAGGARAGLGAALRIPFPARKDLVLFSEERGRVVVSLPAAQTARFEALAREAGAPVIALGAVGGERLEIQAALSTEVGELASAWRRELPRQEDDAPAPGAPEGGPAPSAQA
ncbi:MAG: AIR synthase-related protein [Anaeromyxobacter sp.]